MSNFDPQILITVLEDLNYELTLWSSMASDSVKDFTHENNMALERSQTLQNTVKIIDEEVKENEISVQDTKYEVDAETENCHSALTQAEKALSNSNNVLSQARSAESEWSMKVTEAESRVSSLKGQLATAQRELESAQRELESAQREYSNACSAYNSVSNNKNSSASDVSSAYSRVQAAEHKLRVAEQRVAELKEKVRRLKDELQKALDWLEVCREKLNLARQAVNQASQAVEYAKNAISLSKEAELSIYKAGEFLKIADENLKEEIELNEILNVKSKKVDEVTNESQSYFKQGLDSETSAQNYFSSAKREIDKKIDLLYELNRSENIN